MENASKALIMAAGVLIGVLILSLAAFLFVNFGAKSSQIYNQIENQKLTKFNAQFTIYSGREDINIYDIVTVINKAVQNNEDYTEQIDDYKIDVYVGPENATDSVMNPLKPNYINDLITSNNQVNENGEINSKFKCKDPVTYHDNGRIKKIIFKQKT